MNVITKHGLKSGWDKKIMSSDLLFFACVSHCFLNSDKDEKNPIPYLSIYENIEDNERLVSIYFHTQPTQNEVVIHSKYGSNLPISATKLFQLATFVNDVKTFVSKNPVILTEARYS